MNGGGRGGPEGTDPSKDAIAGSDGPQKEEKSQNATANRWPEDPAERAAAIRKHIDELVPVNWPEEEDPVVY